MMCICKYVCRTSLVWTEKCKSDDNRFVLFPGDYNGNYHIIINYGYSTVAITTKIMN